MATQSAQSDANFLKTKRNHIDWGIKTPLAYDRLLETRWWI